MRIRPRHPRRHEAGFLAFLRSLPCCVCGTRRNVEAAHVRFADAASGKEITGMGRKPDDRDALPLCDVDHRLGPRAQHKMGEREFWAMHGLDAIELLKKYRADYEFFQKGP